MTKENTFNPFDDNYDPEFHIPEFNEPELNIPELNEPELSIPELNEPELSIPEFDKPRLDESQSEDNTKNKTEKSSPLKNIIKTRDDHKPIYFGGNDSNEKFKAHAETEASWITKDQEFGYPELRTRIEPWLTALFQSEHLSLLAGSGFTYAITDLARAKPEEQHKAQPQQSEQEDVNTIKEKSASEMMDLRLPHSKPEVGELLATESTISANKAGRDVSNFEDQLRVANELLRGYEILQLENEANNLKKDLTIAFENFVQDRLTEEKEIITGAQDSRVHAFNILVTFLMSFASRTGTRDRLNIFTTNYDRLIETGAEIAGLHLLDRFLGNLMPIFRSSRLDLDMHYNPPGIRGEPRYLEGVARFTKLHGSLDWVQINKDIRRIGLPFGASSIQPYLDAPGLNDATPYNLMIYPNASKDRETADYPYVDLFRDFAAANCRPNSTLVTYGYSFGDDHINRVIRDMLTIPSTHLVIISYNDPLGRIMKTFNELGRPAQISLLIGPALADIETLTNQFLPKAAIDKTTFRMSELLNRRFGAKTQQSQKPNGDGLKTDSDLQ